jgi:hypothetical protein
MVGSRRALRSVVVGTELVPSSTGARLGVRSVPTRRTVAADPSTPARGCPQDRPQVWIGDARPHARARPINRGEGPGAVSRREHRSLHRCRQLRRTAADASPCVGAWQRLGRPTVTGAGRGGARGRPWMPAHAAVGAAAAGRRRWTWASAPRVPFGPRLAGCLVRTLLGTLTHTSRAPGRSRILTPRTSRSPRARGPPRGNDPSGAPAGNLDRPRARPSIDLPLEARS